MPEQESQPIVTQRSGGLDIFDKKFTVGESAVRSSASPGAKGAMNIQDELGAESPENAMEAEAECLSAGLLNIKLVRTADRMVE